MAKQGLTAPAGQAIGFWFDFEWTEVRRGAGSKTWNCSAAYDVAETRNRLFPVGPNGTLVNVESTTLARPRFAYFAAINCENSGLDMTYNIRAVNPGDKWIRQFGVDEQGLLPTYLIFTIVFIVGLATHMYGVFAGWSAQGGMHPIIKLLTVSILFETLSIVLGAVHYGMFMGNGVGAPVLLGVSEVMDMAAQLLLMLLLILIAKGWTISSLKLTGRRSLFIFLALFTFGYASLFIWQEAGTDPESTKYLYESIPGIILLAMRIVTLFWYCYNLWSTWRLESNPEKKRFYAVFGFLYFLWFLALPLIVIVATVQYPWERSKTVSALYLLFNMAAFSGLGWLLWPSRAANYFRISAQDLWKGASDGYDKL